ncbi:hypothetical protein QTG56_24400 (plasmid) [Rossellomorea sp. AcN35-11]|nr:hypothetical protein [Rossellomorea aquimaris]WJV31776.1 hypothetical protein QTG56_24400 [Rossellomorea sp. AcN35-11]
MRDLPEGQSVQIVKKSTKKSMFDIYAMPINNNTAEESTIKLKWETVEYGKKGQPARANAHANMDFETGAKIAKDILDGHPFAAKLPVLREVEKDLGDMLQRINKKADKEVIRLMIENSLSQAIDKAYLTPNRIRETWKLLYDKYQNPYYQCVVSGGGKGTTMLESRYVAIEAREYKGELQYHVTTAITEGVRGEKGAVLPKEGAPVSSAKTIVKCVEMVEAMEKLLLFIQGSVTYDVAKGTYRPFTINNYPGNQSSGNGRDNGQRDNGHSQPPYHNNQHYAS